VTVSRSTFVHFNHIWLTLENKPPYNALAAAGALERRRSSIACGESHSTVLR
jgi:hypothetical protein